MLADLRAWYSPLVALVVDRVPVNPWIVTYDVEYIKTRIVLETERIERIGMTKAAIVLLTDTETKEGLGRMSNALTSVREFKEENQEVTLIFDGAGTKWIGELSDPDHKSTTSTSSR